MKNPGTVGAVSGAGVEHDWTHFNHPEHSMPAARHHCAIYPARHHAGDGE